LLRTLADGTVDTGAADTGAADTWAVDTGAEDTGAADTGATDTGVADTEAAQSRIVRCELLNVTHLVAQLADVSLSATSVAIGVHACNAASLELLNAARAAGSAWAVMPCCIPEKLYMPNTAVTHLPDDLRYAATVGAIAQRFEASKVTCVDRRITNRHLLVFGEPDGPQPSCGECA